MTALLDSAWGVWALACLLWGACFLRSLMRERKTGAASIRTVDNYLLSLQALVLASCLLAAVQAVEFSRENAELRSRLGRCCAEAADDGTRIGERSGE